MAERIAKRLLIVGWDAADWMIIDRLFAGDAMPHVRGVVQRGVRANLASLEPRLSPLLWTSIATGKTADKHGILHFVEPDPSGDGLRIVASTSRKVKALWNMCTQAGLRVNVVNWYASHPAEPISGKCVSNLFQDGMPALPEEDWPLPDAAVWPADSTEQIADARMRPHGLTTDQLRPLVPRLAEADPSDARVGLLARHVAQCVSIHNAVTTILSQDDAWDCTMVFYDAIDTIGHHFMQYHPPRMPHVSQRDFELYRDVMFSLYQFHDMMLGTLLDLAGPDTTLILLSDHGFHSDHHRPVTVGLSDEQRAAAEAMWHRPLGVLAMSGPGIAQGQRVYGASLLDIAPTALALLGLPIGADMPGRVLREAFDRTPQTDSVFSWEMLEGKAGMHPAGMRSAHDAFASYDAIRQLVDLGYMAALPQDRQAQIDFARRETRFNLATVYTVSGQAHLAAPIFQELAAQYLHERRYVFGSARCLHVLGRYDDAVAALDAWLARRSDDIEALALLGLTLASAGDKQRCAAVLDQIERSCDNRAEALQESLGDMCAALGRWEDADLHYRRALENDPTNAKAHFGLARCGLIGQQFEGAVEHALQAVEIVHFFPDAHHLVGVALTWLKDYDHAIKAFEVALSMRPGLLDAHRFLASIHRLRGDSASAAKHREAARRLLSERQTGRVSVDFLRRETPMGPQDWAQRMGMEADEAGDAA